MRPRHVRVGRPMQFLAFLIVAGGCVIIAGVLAASADQQVFRAEAGLVEVIVRVTDERGQFVPGLRPTDFEVRDQGRVQAVVAFDVVDLPPSSVDMARTAKVVARDVSTNEGLGEGRLFVLLLDDILTSPMFAIPVRRLAREFIEEHVEPGDQVAVFSTAGHGVLNQEFTTDKTRVLDVVDRFLGTDCTRTPNENRDAQEGYRVQVATDVMAAVAAHLSGIRGRRVSLLWVSEGIGYEPSTASAAAAMAAVSSGGVGASSTTGGAGTVGVGAVAEAMRRALDTLRQANVTVYAVDPRKLWSPDMMPAGNYEPVPCQNARRAVDVLRSFSEQTGGFAAVDTNDFRDAFSRIVQEGSQYYVLGFQPDRPGRPGDFRRIDVRLRARQGLRTSARPGYVVARESGGNGPSSGTLADALSSNLPATGLPLRVQAIVQPGETATSQVHLVVEVGGGNLKFAAANGRHREQLELALLTVDGLARSGPQRQITVGLDLSANEADDLRRSGVRWLTSVPLSPGHHRIRIAAHGVESRRNGAVFMDVDVPSLEDRLWVGGLALTTPAAARTPTGGESLAPLGLPTPPTTARTFALGDELTIGVQLATPERFTTGSLTLAVSPAVPAGASAPLVERSIAIVDRKRQSYTWTVNTSSLGIGAFSIQIRARDDTGATAEAESEFVVTQP